jgi:hypothetical protein
VSGKGRAACRQTREESARASTVPVKGVLQRGVYACTRLAPIVISLILPVVSLNCCDEVLSAEYHNIRASQGMKFS